MRGRKTEKETDRDQPMTCVMQRDCSDSSLPSLVIPAVSVCLCVCVHACVCVLVRVMNIFSNA